MGRSRPDGQGGREHRVPLSGRAHEVLAEARPHSDGSPLVFPQQTGGEMAHWRLSKLPARVNIDGTLHGMRSSFRDCCGETGVTPRSRRGVPRSPDRVSR